ncbi:19045_t:CDS:1, partial [Dentiscutata erythropus]
ARIYSLLAESNEETAEFEFEFVFKKFEDLELYKPGGRKKLAVRIIGRLAAKYCLIWSLMVVSDSVQHIRYSLFAVSIKSCRFILGLQALTIVKNAKALQNSWYKFLEVIY